MPDTYPEHDAAWPEVEWPGTCLSQTLGELLEDPALTKPPEAVEERFAWRGRVTLLAGREKAGKSTLAAWIAARVSRRGQRVLWLILEGHKGELVQSLVRFGADRDRVHVMSQLPEGLTSLHQEAKAIGPALTVLDTLPSLAELLGSVREHSNDAGGWTRLQNSLGAYAQSLDTALIEVSHAKKSDGTYRDSTAIGAGVDQILEMKESEQDGSLRTFRPRGRWHVPAFGIRLVGDDYRLDAGELSLDAQIVAFLRTHPGSSLSAIRAQMACKGSETDDAIKRLVTGGVIADAGSSSRRAYRLLAPESENGGTRSGQGLGQPPAVPSNSLSDKHGTSSRTTEKPLTPPPLREGVRQSSDGQGEIPESYEPVGPGYFESLTNDQRLFASGSQHD